MAGQHEIEIPFSSIQAGDEVFDGADWVVAVGDAYLPAAAARWRVPIQSEWPLGLVCPDDVETVRVRRKEKARV